MSLLKRLFEHVNINIDWSSVFNPTRLQLAGLGCVLAVIWWGVALWLSQNNAPIDVWGDQAWVFLKSPTDILNPYKTVGFINMPWAKLMLLPVAILPFSVAVLAQLVIFFVILAVLIDIFSRPDTSKLWKVVGLGSALLSPLALDNAVELNIDWIVALGLLVPPAYSAPFLLVKPQNAIGYLASFDRRTLTRWITVALITLLISFIIWGGWPLDWYESFSFRPFAYLVNMAPMIFIGRIPAFIIGAILLLIAVWRKNAVAGIWGGMFFVPFIASYSMLIPYTLLAAIFPRVTLLLTVCLWMVTAIVIINY